MKIAGSNRGFTIVELLAVVSILVVISGIITGVLYSTLRGSNKVKITTELSQNGTYALGFITRAVSDSRSVTRIGTTQIGILENEGDKLDCTESPSGKSITFKRLNGSTTSFACVGTDVQVDGVSLINTDQIQSDYATCNFECTQNTDDLYAIPIIKITLKLSDKSAAAPESRASSTFETSVALRNNLP